MMENTQVGGSSGYTGTSADFVDTGFSLAPRLCLGLSTCVCVCVCVCEGKLGEGEDVVFFFLFFFLVIERNLILLLWEFMIHFV